jgi:hypothetical protein
MKVQRIGHSTLEINFKSPREEFSLYWDFLFAIRGWADLFSSPLGWINKTLQDKRKPKRSQPDI